VAGEQGRRHTSRRGLRYGVAIIITLVVVLAFTVRLIDIQIVSAAELTAEAKDRRALESPVYGARGDIVDRNGNVLADSVERYDITVSPKVALGFTELNGSVEQALTAIAAITGQDPAAMMQVMAADPESDYAVLSQDLTLEQYQAVDALNIAWVYAVRVQARTYPNGAVAGSLLGFVGKDKPLAGLEISENSCLAAQDGLISYERSEDGVRIPDTEVTEVPAVNGGTVQLTIDRDLQWYLQETVAKAGEHFGATWGSVAVVRVSDGAIMALTDWPTLDPNDFQDADPSLTGSRAFALPYEPGSIMKPINAAIAIDLGTVTPTTQLDAPYAKDFGEAGRITDATWHTPNLTVTGSLVDSSNTGTSDIADTMPNEPREQYLENFGFGQISSVDFFGESGGYLPALQDWDARTRLVMGYGQAMSATVLQMASAYQALGNDGLRMPLKLVESCTQADGTVVPSEEPEPIQVVRPDTAAQVRNMLEMVFLHNGVTDSLSIPGYRLGVKSGTAEVSENGEYGNKVVISYAGLVPIDRPEYSIVVSLGVPWAAFSSNLAPYWRDIASQVITMFHVQPSSGAANELPLTW
jgi:cell division protein FtsI (penicillin-binding protein 3)